MIQGTILVTDDNVNENDDEDDSFKFSFEGIPGEANWSMMANNHKLKTVYLASENLNFTLYFLDDSFNIL